MPSEADPKFEPMFDTKKNFSDKALDAADLVIDFATLGEYGLEPVEQPRPCEARRRPVNRRSTGAWNSAIDRFAASC
jgi:hypothetical protein